MDGLHNVLRRSFPVLGSQGFQNHQLYVLVVGDACYASVAPAGGDGSRPVGSVIVLGSQIKLIIIIEEIPSMDVIDVAVSIVVDSVLGNLVLVGPDGVCQIRVLRVDAGVNDRHHRLPLGRSLIVKVPGGSDVDIHTGNGIGGYFVEISRFQPWKADGVHRPGFVQVDVDSAQGFQVQLGFHPAEAPFIFQGPLVVGEIVPRREAHNARAVLEETVAVGR